MTDIPDLAPPTLDLEWEPPGPVAEAFMQSTAMVQILNGPIGSGKTTAACIKAVRLASKQRPSRKYRMLNPKRELVPVRRFRLTVVRDTYRQLWRSTLPSWWSRIPKEAGEWTGAENAPGTHVVKFELNPDTVDSNIVEFKADFGAIGEHSVEDFMRGYETTGWYLNEMDRLAQEVFSYALGRAGRYPDIGDGGPSWYGVLGDCNAPEFENWLYTDPERDPLTGKNKRGIFTMTPRERATYVLDRMTPQQREQLGVDRMTPEQLAFFGVALFIQPGGREPDAENLKNLIAGYYVPKPGQGEHYVARMIDNKSGYSQAGKPVHPEFKAHRHVASHPLEPIPGLPLTLGLDPKTYPTAVFIQHLPNGQRRVIDELQGEQNTGPRRFGRMLAERLHERWPFVPPKAINTVIDPSALYGADREDGVQDWAQIVSAVSGIRIKAAVTNSLPYRREALKKPLETLIDGEPALLINPDCTLVCTALASGFRFRRLNTPGAARFSPEVEKNEFADVGEALEYGCLADGAEYEISERKRARFNASDDQIAAEGDGHAAEYERARRDWRRGEETDAEA